MKVYVNWQRTFHSSGKYLEGCGEIISWTMGTITNNKLPLNLEGSLPQERGDSLLT